VKIDIDSTFEEFSAELDAKASAIYASPGMSIREVQEALFNVRRDAFNVASQCFPSEVKVLLNHHQLIRKFGVLVTKAEAHLRRHDIKYNIFQDILVLQIISKNGTTHERFMFTDILMKEYLGITVGTPHYHLIAGFCEDPKVNETLQLIFYLVTGAVAD
jgi:hypothetical protein